ncbi:MAG: winged helix-turn-helix domain-containing protein [Maritimibacter sp.]
MSGDSHVLLVDADANKRVLLRKFLARKGFMVTGARDVDHAKRLLAGLDFDLIVTEDGAGRADLAGMTTGVVLTLVRAGCEVDGASLQIPFEPDVLLDRMNVILDRVVAPVADAPKALRFGGLVYDLERGDLMRAGERVKLTATEGVLMRVLAARVGAPVTRAELCDAVGGDAPPTARAVDVQMTRLRRKLEVDPKVPRILQTVRGTGYMLAAQRD